MSQRERRDLSDLSVLIRNCEISLHQTVRFAFSFSLECVGVGVWSSLLDDWESTDCDWVVQAEKREIICRSVLGVAFHCICLSYRWTIQVISKTYPHLPEPCLSSQRGAYVYGSHVFLPNVTTLTRRRKSQSIKSLHPHHPTNLTLSRGQLLLLSSMYWFSPRNTDKSLIRTSTGAETVTVLNTLLLCTIDFNFKSVHSSVPLSGRRELRGLWRREIHDLLSFTYQNLQQYFIVEKENAWDISR